MFDRPIETSPRPGSLGVETEQGIEEVCALYDGLLTDPPAKLSEEDEGALVALAGVYDIDARRPHAEVWRDLRAVLTRQPARAADDAPAPVEPAREPLTLLLVEDDPETAADLTAVLSEAGHNVVGPFHQAEAAEAAVALHSLDLALLDINLSGARTGADLARDLKSRWGLPVMFLTGDLAQAAAHADLSEALILKPYSGRDVLEALAAYQATKAEAAAGSTD